MFLGKFNNLIKVETFKCANKALMRCNSHCQCKVTQISTEIRQSTGHTAAIEGKKSENSNQGSQAEHLQANPNEIDSTLMRTDSLYGALYAEHILNSCESQNTKVASTKESGVKYLQMKVKGMPLWDSSGPLSNGAVLRPLKVELQQRAYESSANVSNNPYYNGKRFDSIHTERTSVSFKCPMERRIKKGESAHNDNYRKMDCCSLKDEGALAIFADKPKRFGCKVVKKPKVNQKPNACGEIFECPKKVVEPPKKDNCAPSVPVLIQQEFVQRFHNVLGKICKRLKLNPGKYFLFREMVAEAIAANVAQISPQDRPSAVYKVEDWLPVARNRTGIVHGRNASFGIRKHSDRSGLKSISRVPYKTANHNKFNDQVQQSEDSGLRISDAELLRLTLKDTSVDTKADFPLRTFAYKKIGHTESVKSQKSRNELDEEFVSAPTSVLTPLMPPRDIITDGAIGSVGEDMRTLAIEGGKVEVNTCAKDGSQASKSKGDASKDFKPIPGQVCCPKDKAEAGGPKQGPPTPTSAPAPPPQVCCPPKDKSNQAAAKNPPPPPGPSGPPKPQEQKATKPNAEPQQKVGKAGAEAVPKAAGSKPPGPQPPKKAAVRNVVADDPSVFNCCLSIVGQHKVEINNCPMPELCDEDVIVKMHTVALGTSDIYLFDRGVTKETGPVVLGHEGSGVVFKVGKNVKHLRPGDIVAIEPGIACGCCPYCKSGRYNLCPSMKFNGLLQTYCSHPAHFCYKVPKELDATQAALTHPVAMALHACRRANVCVGSTVLVLGACPLGLSVVMTARAMGADKILIIDTLEKNLRLAYDLCADKTILATPEMTSDMLAEKVVSELKCNPNVVIDCCGCTRTVNVAGLALKPGGFFVLAGCQVACADMPILAMLAKEICACASFRTSNEFANAMCLIASKRANVSKLITHKTEFCDAQQGFEWALNEEKSGAIKVLVYWPHTEKR